MKVIELSLFFQEIMEKMLFFYIEKEQINFPKIWAHFATITSLIICNCWMKDRLAIKIHNVLKLRAKSSSANHNVTKHV